MSYRSIFAVLLMISSPLFEVRGQEILYDNRPDQLSDWNAFQPEVQTRMGKVRIGEMPENVNFSRITPNGAKMGRFNTFLGIDIDAPGMRLGNYKKPEPLLPTDFLSEKPAAGKTERPSANVPIERPENASQSTPLRRHPDFFERPDVVSAPSESQIPTEQRWFRDIGRRPGLGDMSGRSRNPMAAPGGEAVMVGSEMQQESAPDPGTAPETTNLRVQAEQKRRELVTAQANQRRRFEQKLETMLLGSPNVQFLSPVQVSFQNGVATVRGIVPDQQHKVAAGNVLLGDPTVKQVNNLISTVPTDPGKLPAPIEPK